MVKPKDFAIYRGDTFEFLGSSQECAEHLGIKRESVYYYSTPAYKKRSSVEGDSLVVIALEEDVE